MRSKGFTLVEVIVSISVASILIVSIFNLFFGGLKVYEKISQNIKNMEVVVFVTDKITSDIIQSSGIDPSSTLQKMILSGEKEIIYEYRNKKVRRSKDGNVRYLTIENDIKNVSFNYMEGGVEIMLSTRRNDYSFSVYPRGAQ